MMHGKIQLIDCEIIAMPTGMEIFVNKSLINQCSWILGMLDGRKGWKQLPYENEIWAGFCPLEPTARVMNKTWANDVGAWLNDMGFNWTAEALNNGKVIFTLVSVRHGGMRS